MIYYILYKMPNIVTALAGLCVSSYPSRQSTAGVDKAISHPAVPVYKLSVSGPVLGGELVGVSFELLVSSWYLPAAQLTLWIF